MSGLPQVELSQEPQMPLAEGQLHCCHIALRNTGAMPLQDLRLAVAPTAVLLTQPHEAADPDPLTFLRGTLTCAAWGLAAGLCSSVPAHAVRSGDVHAITCTWWSSLLSNRPSKAGCTA